VDKHGQEKESEERRRNFAAVSGERNLMDLAPADALFMHCLPAHRGEEVTDEVVDGLQSVVLEQAGETGCTRIRRFCWR